MGSFRNFLQTCDKGADWVSALFFFVGSLATIALVAMTVVAVFFRYFLNDPIFGMDDLTIMTLSLAVAAAIVYGGKSGSHVHVDILSLLGGKKVTRYTDIVVKLLSIGIVAIAAYGLFKQGSCGTPCGYFTPNLTIPYMPFYFFLGTAMVVYALILILELLNGLVHFDAEGETD